MTKQLPPTWRRQAEMSRRLIAVAMLRGINPILRADLLATAKDVLIATCDGNEAPGSVMKLAEVLLSDPVSLGYIPGEINDED